jgi:hypothetical protein
MIRAGKVVVMGMDVGVIVVVVMRTFASNFPTICCPENGWFFGGELRYGSGSLASPFSWVEGSLRQHLHPATLSE